MSGANRQSRTADTRTPAWVRISPALEGQRVHEALVRHGAAALLGCDGIRAISVERVHFGSQMGVIVDYAIVIATNGAPDREVRAFGQIPWGDAAAARDAAAAKLGRVSADRGHGPQSPRVLLLPELGVLFRPAGFDERIGALSALADAPPDLAEAFEAAGVDAKAGFTLVAHRLGKRAVLRADAGAAAARSRARMLKAYKSRSDSAARSAEVQNNVALHFARACGEVNVPAVTGVLPAMACFVMEEAHGRSLATLAPAERPRAMGHAGQAAAHLHSAALDGLEGYGVADEIALLEAWVQFVAGVSAAQGAVFHGALDRVKQSLAETEVCAACPIHRDFHERQVLWRDGSATLLDFDTVRLGDPAQDVGNFLAHLRFAELVDGFDASETKASFLEGYHGASGSRPHLPSSRNVIAHERATLLRLALINWFSERRRHVVGRLVELV